MFLLTPTGTISLLSKLVNILKFQVLHSMSTIFYSFLFYPQSHIFSSSQIKDNRKYMFYTLHLALLSFTIITNVISFKTFHSTLDWQRLLHTVSTSWCIFWNKALILLASLFNNLFFDHSSKRSCRHKRNSADLLLMLISLQATSKYTF